ncbi:uncharacterized protein LOC115624557 [Scaptodrosophila lebanonensis]|uniref:Uncharacterized protein LOC115624557 n=1 Tax=Drosophila lebanonensis TaxID=7225 RepID=A0A6J2TJ49_DROLE|nr:uncharacterized protein LOC115624557 [Scaptodrosophila lebanonensis]
MTKLVFVALIVAAISLICVSAAPAQILDAHTAIQKIIAAYNRYPGPSIVHPPEIATLIDPNTFVPNIYG